MALRDGGVRGLRRQDASWLRGGGYRAGYEDYDSARYEHGDSRRLAEDLDYLRGYQDRLAAREREKVEKSDGLWGGLTGK